VTWRGGVARGVVLASSVAVLAGGCGSSQSTLSPQSGAAHDIDTLWWVMFVGSAIVFGVVTVLVLVGALRRRGERAPEQEDTPLARRLVFWGGALIPLVALVALFAFVLHTIPSTSAAEARKGRLTIRVIGHQWFWEVRYPSAGVVTANEIHIPVGVPVRLEARTADVIHSFWVPALNRKIDMIPGRENELLVRADRAGTYRGQCAEFCGVEHGLMAFFVVAEPRERFDAWLAREQSAATSELRKGRDIFMASACSGCHTIRGTAAIGRLGPDLTHVGSRSTLAAGTIESTPAELRRWLRDPQHVKPGNKMPDLGLSDAEIDFLADYLESLR
jgi:cytochrome c oxidase subunit 2